MISPKVGRSFHRSAFSLPRVGVRSCFTASDNSACASFIRRLSTCVEIPAISHCVKYINDGSILGVSLQCRECEEDYYVNEDELCSLRTRKDIENCEVLSLTSDACSVCSEGYYIRDDGSCKIYPLGIPFCQEYITNEICLLCKPNTYLTEDRCAQMPEDELIENCEYYNFEKTCKQCKTGFYRQSSVKCIEGLAENCLTFIDENRCDTCPPGYGKIKDLAVTSCIEIIIPNCLEPFDDDVVGPDFKCKTCNTSFYVNEDGACVSVPKIISYCAIYDTAVSCSFCLHDKVLSANKKNCVDSIQTEKIKDLNCGTNAIVTNPVCNMCGPGFRFASETDRTCVSCGENLGSGCLICDITQPEKCLICISGYYMTNEAKCIIGETPQVEAPPVEEGTVLTKSAWIALLFLLYLSLTV